MSEQTNTNNDAPQTLPLIILDDAVVFPYTVVTLPLDDESAPAADAALKNGRMVLLVARREDAESDAPLESCSCTASARSRGSSRPATLQRRCHRHRRARHGARHARRADSACALVRFSFT